MRNLVLLVLLCLAGALAGCGQRDAAATTQAYLAALIRSDEAELQTLTCAALEQAVQMEAMSFRAVDARLDGVTCRALRTEDGATVVGCDGAIVATYDGEDRDLPISNYRLVQEDGEWKVCGEAGA